MLIIWDTTAINQTKGKDQKVALSDADAEKEYNRKYDLLYYSGPIGDKKINFFDKMLTFDSKKVFILPDESTAHDQN